MTVAQIRKSIQWGNTILHSCREITLPDGYKIAVIKQDEGGPGKEQMDKLIIQAVQEHLGEPLTA